MRTKAFNLNLKMRIMNRVYRFWFLRSMLPLLVIELAVIILAVYFFANLVFVSQVVDNALNAALGNPLKLVAYLWQAFLGTRMAVKVIIVALALTAGLILRDINRSIISYLLTRRAQLFRSGK